MSTGIRPAGPDDAGAIAALEALLFGSEAWSLAQVEAELAAPGCRTWVAEVRQNPSDRTEGSSDFGALETDSGGGAAVLRGYVSTRTVAEIADLQRVGVVPGAQLRGIASSLLEVAVAAAREDGARRMLLEVAEDNAAALAFYGARGFHEIDRRPRYYRQTVAALVMQRVLTAEAAE